MTPTPITTRRRFGALALFLLFAVLTIINVPATRAAAQSCPDFGNVSTVGELSRDNIREASGLVASPNYTNRFWLHNDSGDSARIYAMAGDGEDRGIVNLGGVTARDFEDIAIGPGPNANKDYIYVADIGNNGHGRATLWIHRFAEPAPPGKGKSITVPATAIESFEFAYEKPGEPGKTWRRNGEAIFVDPISQDLVIIEKQLNTVSGKKDMGWVYKIAQANLEEGRVIRAKPKVAIRQRRSSNYGPTTAADISPDGKTIIVKNGSETFAWKRSASQTVYAAFGAHPVTSCHPPNTPGEAIAFTKDGKHVLSVTEQRNSPVRKYSVSGGGGGGTPPPPPNGDYQCAGRTPTIVGTHGDDVIVGTDGPDVIVGLGGDDEIRGLRGNDFICGGPGRDRIWGNQGHDEIHGGDLRDVIRGGKGDDYLVGAAGYDIIFGNDGEDYLAGAVGNDKLYGGAHSDFLVAGVGIDLCDGGPGDDSYQGCE